MSMTINDMLLLHLHSMIMSSFNDNIHDSHHGHEQGPGGWCVGRNARDEKARREHHVFASHCQVQHFIWNKWNLVQHFIYKILVGNTMFLPLIVRYNILSEINEIQIEEKFKKNKHIYIVFLCVGVSQKCFFFLSLYFVNLFPCIIFVKNTIFLLKVNIAQLFIILVWKTISE